MLREQLTFREEKKPVVCATSDGNIGKSGSNGRRGESPARVGKLEVFPSAGKNGNPLQQGTEINPGRTELLSEPATDGNIGPKAKP